jgi:signal transduction histidine kinase
LLLVEDDDADAHLVLRYLRSIDDFTTEVERAVCLTDALRRLEAHQHDVVLLDLGLPEERNLPVLRRVLATNTEVAVIVLTGLDDQAMALAALREGAEDYLTKGETTADSLARSIRYTMGRRRQQQERRVLERHMAETHRLESLGRFAGGIAHEINNRLTPIVGMADLMLTLPPPENRHQEMLELILDAAQGASALVRNLLTFARQRPTGQPQQVDLPALVESTLRLVRTAIPASVTLTTDFGADAPAVNGDPMAIQSVLMNLVSNAVDAFAGREGQVAVTVEAAATPPEVASHGASLRLAVSDDGPGMDREMAAHIFEPFFTTKAVNKGTGLGLSVVHGIVADLGGCIRVNSDIGRGTTVEVFLPALAGDVG